LSLISEWQDFRNIDVMISILPQHQHDQYMLEV